MFTPEKDVRITLKPSSMSIEITVNSIARGVIYVDNRVAPAVYTGSTGVAVFALNQGDDCFIRTHSTYNPSDHCSHYQCLFQCGQILMCDGIQGLLRFYSCKHRMRLSTSALP
jgi:hypothetical protein